MSRIQTLTDTKSIIKSLRLGSGEEVIIQPGNRLLQSRNASILSVLPEALMKVDSSIANVRGFIKTTVTFDVPIGTTDCVKTTQEDDVFFAVQLDEYNRTYPGQTRFVRGREPEETNELVVILRKFAPNSVYRLANAYPGEREPVEPWEANASFTREEYEFWTNHAYLAQCYRIAPGSETEKSPLYPPQS